jgi:hypothetical protein
MIKCAGITTNVKLTLLDFKAFVKYHPGQKERFTLIAVKGDKRTATPGSRSHNRLDQAS